MFTWFPWNSPNISSTEWKLKPMNLKNLGFVVFFNIINHYKLFLSSCKGRWVLLQVTLKLNTLRKILTWFYHDPMSGAVGIPILGSFERCHGLISEIYYCIQSIWSSCPIPLFRVPVFYRKKNAISQIIIFTISYLFNGFGCLI